MNAFVTREGSGRGLSDAYIDGGLFGSNGKLIDIGADIFDRGLCLPSDNKMTTDEQDKIIEIIRSCFE
jgi:dTDP-4-amino-4,6-dideoxygalactose transaminase